MSLVSEIHTEKVFSLGLLGMLGLGFIPKKLGGGKKIL